MVDDETETTYQQPSFAAEQVGVSASGLRRLASIYAEVHSELPRDSADNRLWPSEAVERLKAARALVQSGRVRSTKEALEALSRGINVPTEVLAVATPPEGALGVLIVEALVGKPSKALATPPEGALGVLIEEIRALRQEIAALREESGEIKRQLKALEPPKADTADLERRNRYLMGELERRDAEAEKVKRPWWKWW